MVPNPPKNTAPQPWIKPQPRYAATAAKQTTTGGKTRRGSKSASPPSIAPTTRITVIRKGGVPNQAEEHAIRGRPLAETIMALHTAIESLSSSAPQLISGHWTSSASTTGNFQLSFNGTIPFDKLTPYTKIIRSVLGCGDIAPVKGWPWTQLHKVPTSDNNGHRYDNNNLNYKVRHNACFATALFGMAPHWQQSPSNILCLPASTVFIPIVDTMDMVIKVASQQGVFMLGKQVKFVVTGDSPRLIQCSHCHLLGHPTRSPLCKLHPAAVKCYHCGGAHHSNHHDYECKGTHRTPGRCNCKPKCLLCRNMGHHARSHKCPKRGDFTPPRLDEAGTKSTPIHVSSFVSRGGHSVTDPSDGGDSACPSPPKNKGKKANKKGQATIATNHYELPDPNKALWSFLDGPEAFITEWAKDDQPGKPQNNFSHISPVPLTIPGDTPCPRDSNLNVFPMTTFASIEDIAERDALQTHRFTISECLALYDEEEEGWGGLPKFTCKRHGLRACLALRNNLPLNKNDIIARVTAKLLKGSKVEDGIRALNWNFGGIGDNDHVTSHFWFQNTFPANALITEFPLPDTIKKVITMLGDNEHDLFEVAEDFDIQMGGDSKGDALLQAIDHPFMPNHILHLLRAWAEEPDLDSSSQLVEHAFLAHSITLSTDITSSQDSVRTATSVSGIWFWKRLLQNHVLAVDANFAEMTPQLADLLARTHLRTDHVLAGCPASRYLHP